MATSPPPRVIARHGSFLFFFLLLLLLPLLALSKSSPRPITDEEIREKKNACYADIESREGELRPAVPLSAMLRARLRRRSLGRRREGLRPRARVQILHAQVVHGRQPRRCEGGLQFLTPAHGFIDIAIVTFAPASREEEHAQPMNEAINVA